MIAPNLALATLWSDWLCQAGIPTTVQRVWASSIAGELPPDQTLPELWVENDADLERAATLLEAFKHPPSQTWACPNCKEIIDGPFEQCWNCGHPMPPRP
ncbi:putative signal transducing protein [Piscinibacter sakaiensis]|uniref:putative signal transducing protein n=1 Tax=Piscinibacter sakaiensis TaxID=1547922 RepID=UPI003AACBEF8